MLNKMSKEELEVLSYADLAEIILKEKDKSLNTKDIFSIICDLLSYTDDEFTNKIGDFYTSLSTDKRFVFLDTNEWELREKHPVAIVLEDDDVEEETDSYKENSIDEELEDIDETDVDVDIDELDDLDDLDDLSVLTEDEMEEE